MEKAKGKGKNKDAKGKDAWGGLAFPPAAQAGELVQGAPPVVHSGASPLEGAPAAGSAGPVASGVGAASAGPAGDAVPPYSAVAAEGGEGGATAAPAAGTLAPSEPAVPPQLPWADADATTADKLPDFDAEDLPDATNKRNAETEAPGTEAQGRKKQRSPSVNRG